ncbi:Lanthionine synthetase C-like protein [Streptomyces sp. DvalAA-14]|uniref:class III lanthionine synthetase LanKC n=1 Tax=unclassified Streptomyces TaxID=2593676 RepID=UPI00081B2064|nr:MULTISPECIES: class III lanthionine synthetase LanKC [unclassified Streptomyces]MYS24233.1 lantipeptide synthetase [Streptomyces sp. SID4948]SCE44019.1 Lanthionine synthetase C-like protein [Streptomyces sp. DvalAA-14]
MDNRYEVFCLADRHFYESLDRMSAGSGAVAEKSGVLLFDTARREVPAGWRTLRDGDWLHVDPPIGADAYPTQGWKVHVSAALDNADAVAARVWDYCVPRHIPFKFVPGPQLLHLRNSKYAGRDTSGKFVTIYPADEERLRVVLRELGDLLDGEPGPYILTDLRWREGPLYVRYGAFAKRYCVGDRGSLVPAIEDPEGRLVPDSRAPAFHLPDWVTLPTFLAPHLAARNATTVADLPYRIEKALHFSNGGGVYTGVDTRTGEQVVLKEGRPHAGLASDGADAVARLEREREALSGLSGLGVAPEVRDWFTIGDHRFLVMDFLDGRTLNSFFGHRHPLLTPEPDPAAVGDWTRWALRIHAGVEKAVAAVHSRGIVFNDLHMFNIMVGPDEETVRLLDFEAAAPAAEHGRQVVAHPGFVAPPDRRGFDVDRYALACLRLALFLPITTLFAIDRGKAAHLAEVIAGEFPVPRSFLEEAVAEITRDAHPGDGERPLPVVVPQYGAAFIGPVRGPDRATAGSSPQLTGVVPPQGSRRDGSVGSAEALYRATRPAAVPAGGTAANTSTVTALADRRPRAVPAGYLPVRTDDWDAVREAMARALLASASPEREDRLFPGDIMQFTDGGGLGIAHGAAGVLHAFAETGLPRYPQGERWLLDRTRILPNGIALGLYDGVAGIAYVLDRLGHTGRAMDLTRRLLAENWQRLTSDLSGGLAGIGLVLDHLARATGETDLGERALEAARIIAGRLAAAPGAGSAPRRAGLMRGAAGPALLFLRLFEHTGAPGLLDQAARALDLDLDSCVRTSSGSLEVDEGWRTMPYVGDGSAGIGLVLDDFLALARGAGDLEPATADRYEQARLDIVRAATLRLYAQPGLFVGRAGMVLHLARTTADVPEGALAAQVDALGWYGIPYGDGLAFPGNQMMRLSMDLGTGTAGCLLALGSALGDTPAALPFLPPLPVGGP